MTTYRLWPSTNGPAAATNFTGPFGPGIKFTVTSGGLYLAGFWWWVCSTGGQSTSAQPFCLWQVYGSAAGILVPGTEVTSGTLSAGWNYVAYTTPVPLSAGATYQAQTAFSGPFPLTDSEFASGGAYAAGIVSGPLTAFSDSTGSNPDPYGNSQCVYQPSSTDPTSVFAADADAGWNCWLDIQITTTAPSGATYRLWPSLPDNLTGVSSDVTGYILASEFSLTQASSLDKIWHYSPSGAASLPTRCALWNVSATTEVAGTDNSSPSWLLPAGGAASAGGGWVYCNYSSAGVSLSASVNYKVSTYHASGSEWMSVTGAYWSTGPGSAGITNGIISAPDNAGGSPGQGSYQTTWVYPGLTTGSENYWVDVEVTPAGGIAHTATASLALTPSFTASRTRGKYRASTLAVTPSFTAVRTRGKYRTASTTVTPAFTAARIHGKYRTASLAVTPGLTTQRAHGQYRTASLDLIPAFTAYRSHGNARSGALVIHPGFTALRRHGNYRSALLGIIPQFHATGQIPSSGIVIFLTGSPGSLWDTGTGQAEWVVGSYSMLGISQLSTQYISVPVTAAKNGSAYNPTGDAVQFAFMPTATQVPQSGDWVNGSWISVPSNVLYPYSAQALIGPSGTANPGIGTYIIYLKITDDPEIPVLIAGQLAIS
jgi:hypothetical protein